jgi:hypothetical protein
MKSQMQKQLDRQNCLNSGAEKRQVLTFETASPEPPRINQRSVALAKMDTKQRNLK